MKRNAEKIIRNAAANKLITAIKRHKQMKKALRQRRLNHETVQWHRIDSGSWPGGWGPVT